MPIIKKLILKFFQNMSFFSFCCINAPRLSICRGKFCSRLFVSVNRKKKRKIKNNKLKFWAKLWRRWRNNSIKKECKSRILDSKLKNNWLLSHWNWFLPKKMAKFRKLKILQISILILHRKTSKNKKLPLSKDPLALKKAQIPWDRPLQDLALKKRLNLLQKNKS